MLFGLQQWNPRLGQATLLLAAPGLLALVAEPAAWLARTWSDPAYQSDGEIVALES